MNFYLSKSDTQVLKGVAILQMIWLHLFNKLPVAESCDYLFAIGGLPFPYILTRTCVPVSFFLLLSGYGLAYNYERDRVGLKRQGKRILKLYINWWIVLAVFVPLGCLLKSDQYLLGGVKTWIDNITGVNTTFNYEVWFLYPYALLALTSKYIFKCMDWLGNVKSVIISYLLSFVAMYIISRRLLTGIFDNLLLGSLVIYFDLLCAFVIGAVFYRLSTNHQVVNEQNRNKYLLGIVVLLVVMCVVHHASISVFYTTTLVYLLMNMKRPQLLDRILGRLGKYSMMMWMTHTFFCNYLFHDYIYAFKYPILIFVVLVSISLLVSIVLLKVSNLITSRI